MPAWMNILRFRGTVSRAHYWAAGLAIVVIFFGSWAFVRMLGSATGSEWVALAIAVLILLALIHAVTALTVARLRHLGASLWWMAAWPLTAPIFYVIVGLLTTEAATAMKTLRTFRSHVSRGQFWTVGGWLLFVWVVWFYTAALLGVAGGWFPTVLIGAWLAFTPFALFVWTALVVGRLRHLGASLWWVALWPLTAPVFWLVVGMLPAHQAEAAGATSPKRGAPVATILLAVCIGALALFVLFLSTA